jgi:hypothetical protein
VGGRSGSMRSECEDMGVKTSGANGVRMDRRIVSE